MGHCHRHHKKQKKQAACILCTLFVVLVLILLLILYFSVFKPKDPNVEVPAMQLLSYSAVGSPPNVTIVSLSLNMQVSIYNPNRGDFSIENGSTARLYYGGAQVGLAAIPINTISSQSFGTIVVSPIQWNASLVYTSTSSMLPISTAVTIVGHVINAHVFSLHSEVVSKCNVSVSLSSPRAYIQSYTCQRSYSL